ncbi:ESPR-type extended signal peptide-containing protein, partial [Halomonas sp. SpR8]|uniref:beta strand repeat-containing protein n=1 Tax=Halomonas sp. SpR8 TaxID=3050463 RepID=UPI0027E50CA9
MNRVFRLIWNRSLGRMVVASEMARVNQRSGGGQGNIGSPAMGELDKQKRLSLPSLILSPLVLAILVASGAVNAQTSVEAGNNIVVTPDGGDPEGFTVATEDEVEFTNVETSGLTVNGTAILSALQVSGSATFNDGLAAGGRITGLADGTSTGDAVNLGQLNTVRDVADNAQTTADTNTGLISTNTSDIATNANDISSNTAAIDTNTDDIAEVRTTASAGWDISAEGGSTENVAPGDSVDFSGDGNVNVSRTGTDLAFSLANEIEVGELTIAGGPSITSAGIDAGGNVITGLADGVVAPNSTDAVTGNQLHNALFEGGSAFGIRYFRANSTADDSTAVGEDSIAIGPNTISTGDSSLAAGDTALTREGAEGAIALGQNATVGTEDADPMDGNGSIAVGRNSQASGNSTIALGDGAGVESELVRDALALGTGASVSGDFGTNAAAIGTNAQASAANATALGNSANASGADATALGSGSQASGASGIALGQGATAAARNNISIGEQAGVGTVGNTANDQVNNVAIGAQAGQNVIGQRNVAMGSQAGNGTEGNDNIAFGENAGSDLTSDSSISIGRNANVNGGQLDRSIAIGEEAGAGTDSIAMGHEASALGINGVALGLRAATQGTGVSLGANTITDSGYVALGAGSRAVQSDVSGAGAFTGNAFNGDAVSVGSSEPGNSFTRRIVNVEDGANETDAVNVRQLREVIDNSGVAVDYDELATRVNTNFSEQIAAVEPNYLSINDGGVPLGNSDNSGANAAQSIALGLDASTTAGATNSTAIGSDVGAEGSSSVALGHDVKALSDNTTVIGNGRTEARDSNGVAIGTSVLSRGDNSIVIGTRSESDDQDGADVVDNSIVIGSDSQSTAREGIVIGRDSLVNAARGIAQGDNAEATAVDAMAYGTQSRASGVSSQANGAGATASGTNAIASGTRANGMATDGIAMGTDAVAGFTPPPDESVRNHGSIAIGDTSAAIEQNAMALGVTARAEAESATAIGDGAEATAEAEDGLAVGSGANVTAQNASAFGQSAEALGIDALAVGSGAEASQERASAFGPNSEALGVDALAVGAGARATEQSASAVGRGAQATAQDASAFGQGASASETGALATGSEAEAIAQNATALGQGAQALQEGSVALGAGSQTASVVLTPSAAIDGNTYTYAGATDGVTSTVSVGQSGNERTITNVAAGRVDNTSTDAINGSQLFGTNVALESLADDVDTSGTSVANVLGGNAAYDPDTHQVTTSNIGGTGESTVDEAIDFAAQGWDVSANGQTDQNVAPGGSVDFSSSDGNIDIARNGTDLTFDLNDDVTVGNSISVGNTSIDGDSVSSDSLTIGGSTFVVDGGNATYNGDELATQADGLNFAGNTGGTINKALSDATPLTISGGLAEGDASTGTNLRVDSNGNQLNLVMARDLTDLDSVTTGNSVLNDDGLTITGGPSITASGGIDANDQVISSVGAGEVSGTSTDAVNGSQLFGSVDSINSAIGGNAVVNADGTITTSDVGNTGEDTVHDAIDSVNTAANAGWNV